MEAKESQIINDLFNLARALSTAVEQRFMSPDHGANIWKHFLKKSGFDIVKKLPEDKKKDI